MIPQHNETFLPPLLLLPYTGTDPFFHLDPCVIAALLGLANAVLLLPASGQPEAAEWSR